MQVRKAVSKPLAKTSQLCPRASHQGSTLKASFAILAFFSLQNSTLRGSGQRAIAKRTIGELKGTVGELLDRFLPNKCAASAMPDTHQEFEKTSPIPSMVLYVCAAVLF